MLAGDRAHGFVRVREAQTTLLAEPHIPSPSFFFPLGFLLFVFSKTERITKGCEFDDIKISQGS